MTKFCTSISRLASIPPTDLSPQLLADNEDTEDHRALLPKRSHIASIVLYYPLFADLGPFPAISEANGDHIAISALHMQPLSRHTVTLRCKDPRDHPVWDQKFFSTHTDRFIMLAAVRNNTRLASTAPLADELDGEIAPTGFEVLNTRGNGRGDL